MKKFWQACILTTILLSTSEAQEVWTHRYSAPTNARLEAAAGVPGLYLVPTGFYTYLRSRDGISWSSVSLPSASLMAATPSGVLGAGDTIWSTVDGLTSVTLFRPSGERAFNPRGIASGNGCWIVITMEGEIIRSADGWGGPWSNQLSPAGTLSGIAFGGGIFLASAGNSFVTSSDGIAWRLKANPDRVVIQGFGNGKFYGLGQFSTDNGNTWEAFAGTSGSNVLVRNDSAQFVAVTSNRQLFTSQNFISWTPRESEITDLSNVSFCGDLWIASSTTGRISTSPVMGASPATAPAVAISPAVEIKWPSITGRRYQIQGSANNATWADVGMPMLGNGSELRFTAPATDGRKFFRVEVR